MGCVVLLCTPSGCSPKSSLSSQTIPLEGRQVRVRIYSALDQATVNAQTPPVYFTSVDPTLRVLDLPKNVNVPITWTGGAWRVGNTVVGIGELIVRPVGAGSVDVNGKAYRGQYRFVAGSADPGNRAFDVVNDVHIDDYLKSVLSKELFPNWHAEAYKAQAIASRTYALYEKNAYRGSERHFDLNPDTRSQVYGGIPAETPKSKQAVEETAGVVLAFGEAGQERIFKAYFSACCGGVGQSVVDAFGGPPMAPLGDKSVGNLCASAPRFNWGPLVVEKDDLTKRFKRFGESQGRPEKNMALVRSVDVEAVNRYGRPVLYRVADVNGNRYLFTGEDMRRAVNSTDQPGEQMYSSFVEKIVNETNQVRFIGGHGHGHGVGMCQYCTQARATAGMRAEAIVLAGYPGAKLVRAY